MQSNTPQNGKLTPIDGRRVPPHSLDAEQAVIGGILLDPKAIDRVIHLVKTDHFYVPKHEIIFGAMIAIHQSENPADITTVSQWLGARDLLDKVGGQEYIGDLMDSCFTSASIEFHAEAIVDTWRRRQLIEACREVATVSRDMNRSWQEVQETLEKKAFEVATGTQKSEISRLPEVLGEELAKIQAMMNGEPNEGLKTGFLDLDAMTGGFRPYELIVMAGRPAMGKSSAAISIACNVAEQGKPIAIFSLEMSKGEVARKVLSARSEIPGGKLESGRITTREWEAALEITSEMGGFDFYINDDPGTTPSSILSICRSLIAKKGTLGCVIVDYLHLMVGGEGDEVKELGKITRLFKKMTKQLGCPIILLSQLSRGVESRTDKRPVMSDIRASGRIEEDADKVIFLYREEYYDPETEERGIAEVIVGKNRNGPTGTIKLLFDPQFGRFRNLSKGRPVRSEKPGHDSVWGF